ncbi:MAG: division/cell wall cluster transcriptional repressor MraZ [bacterium]
MGTKVFFHGRKDYRLDSKGRIPFPTVWYAPFGLETTNKVVVVTGISKQKYLEIFSVESWKEELNVIDAMPDGQIKNKLIISYVAPAETTELDNQNRLRLSKNLIDYAGIDKDVVLAGCIKTVQIWAKEAFEAAAPLDENDFELMYNYMNEARKKIKGE